MLVQLYAERYPKMSTSRSNREEVLADPKRLEDMLVSIVNLPDEEFPESETSGAEESQYVNLTKLREERKAGRLPERRRPYNPSARPPAITEKWWPELWKDIPGQNVDADIRGREVLKKIRTYLRRFWEAKTPRERDWHIYRAREYYERLRILPDVLAFGTQSAQVADALLDQLPPDSHISKALYELQKRATKKSLAPRICPNDDCRGERYFLGKKTGQKYCSDACSQAGSRGIKLEWYHDNKDKCPSQIKRRKKSV